MPLNPKLEKILARIYPADATIDSQYNGKDYTLKINQNGEAVTLFIGDRKADGTIAGERYARQFKTDSKTGKRTSHWDLKGKTN